MTIIIGKPEGGTGGVDPATTMPDGGNFDIGSGSVHDIAQGKYYVTGWDNTQDMPPLPVEVGVMTKTINFEGSNGSRVIFDTDSGKHWVKIKLAGGWEPWDSPTGGDMLKSVYDTDDNGIVDAVDTLPTDTFADDEMLKWDDTVGTVVGTGDINTDTEVDFGSKNLTAATGNFNSGTINLVGYDIEERGGYLQTLSKVTGKTFISVDYEVDDTGSKKPRNDERAVKVIKDITQPVDATTMSGITNYTLSPTKSQDIHRVYIKLVNPVTNFRVRVISDTTGEEVKFIPSRSDFDAGIGLTFAAGERFFDLGTALPEIAGFDLTVEVFADQSIDVLGDGVNPWRAVDSQDIVSLEMVDESSYALESISTSLISGGEITFDTTTTVDIAAGKGRLVSINTVTGEATTEEVSWSDKFGVTITDLLTRSGSRIGIDVNKNAIQFPVTATTQTNRDYINLGVVAHAAGVVGRIVNAGFTTRELYSQAVDSQQSLGVTRRNGLNCSPATLLTFNKSAGEIEAVGAGIESGNRGQNIAAINAETPATFTTVLGLTNTPLLTGQSNIDPANYDNNTGSPVAIGAPASQATIQYVYQSILQPGGLFVMYGQTVYANLDDAVLYASNDVVDVPELILGSSNLIARIAVRSDATDLNDPLQAEFLAGVKFGTGVDGTGLGSGSGGGGDVSGGVSSVINEIPTHADTSGKIIKTGSDIIALAGSMQRSTPNADMTLVPNGTGAIVAGTSKFKGGDDLNYPVVDGLAGDSITTDANGNLVFAADVYAIVTGDVTLNHGVKYAYLSSAANPVTVSLGDNPREGERKLLWISDATNEMTLVSVNPSFPLQPPTPIAEANLEGEWTLNSDFLDRFTTGRDLTNEGTGGAFVPAVINGRNVNAFDFEQTAYLEATASAYKGILGGTRRTFTCWYSANAGQPAGAEYLVSWGDSSAGGGRWWYLKFDPTQQSFEIQIKNAVARYSYTNPALANLFDGNMHHIAVAFSGSSVSSSVLYIDGVAATRDFIDNNPSMNTIANANFKLGASISGGGLLNGSLYDARLFNRGLSVAEVNLVINDDLTGGISLNAAPPNVWIEVLYSGSEWVLSDGYFALISGLEGRVTQIESQAFVLEATRYTPVPDPIQDIDFINQTSVYGVVMATNTTFTFSNAKVGSGAVIEISGDFVPTFPAEWNQLSNSLVFDGTLTNLVYIFCMDDTLGAEVFDYAILRRL